MLNPVTSVMHPRVARVPSMRVVSGVMVPVMMRNMMMATRVADRVGRRGRCRVDQPFEAGEVGTETRGRRCCRRGEAVVVNKTRGCRGHIHDGGELSRLTYA